MKRIFALIGGVLILVLLAACGPSPEQIATMAASAWTPTSLPTSTPTIVPSPTPVPIDLTVTITDESGAPIANASIVLPESGKDAAVQSDAQGKFNWMNLAEESATLKISAQGYITAEKPATLQRGVNEMTVTLKLDPFGLPPSKACAAGETFVHGEDFQSGAAVGWGAYPPGKTITVAEEPGRPGNKALLIDFGNTDGEYQLDRLSALVNVVWRLRYMPGNHSRFNVGLGRSDPGYFMVLSADEFSLNSYSNADGRKFLSTGKPLFDKGIWHFIEFSYYNGKLEVWLDGTSSVMYEGVDLKDANRIGIGSAKLPPDSFIYIDDVSLCTLNAPFQSIYELAR